MTLQDIILKTKEYLNVPAVVRFEHLFMSCLAEDFNTLGYDVKREDGLLVVRKKGLRSPKIVTAHIDRHGIVVNGEGKYEFAAFNAKKHYGDKNKYSKATFDEFGLNFINEEVLAYDEKGKKLEKGRVKGYSYNFKAKNLVFDIDGFGRLPAETSIAYAPQLANKKGMVSSQIDNVISVAVAYQLAKDSFDGTLLFATEEEIGRSWKYITKYLNSQNSTSQEIITLDTTPYDNTIAISEGLVIFRNKDENGKFNSKLVQKLKSACDDQGIKYEMKDEVIEALNTKLAEGAKPKELGRTELGRLVKNTNGKLNGATVQLPTTGYHTNHEETSELALNNYYKTLKLLFQRNYPLPIL